jgi:hypothetical protein
VVGLGDDELPVLGVPRRSRNGLCEVSTRKKESYRALIISVGTVTRGRKLKGSTIGCADCMTRPLATRTLAPKRGSMAVTTE